MVMAGLANIVGLLPIMWAIGTGAGVMKRLSAPMVGGGTFGDVSYSNCNTGNLCQGRLIKILL